MARRLAVVFPHALLGGGEVAMMEVAEGLGRRFEVTAVVLDGGEPAGSGTIRAELRARFARVSFVSERGRLLGDLLTADAALWWGLHGAVPKAMIRLGSGRPASVRVVHTERAEEKPFAQRFRNGIDAKIAVSPAMARQLRGAVSIPNPIPRSRLGGEGRQLFPPGRKTLGFLGRLAPMKNVPWLIESLAELEVNLLLQVLDTEVLTAADLRELARTRGVEDRIHFLPPGREVGTLFKSIDALILPSSSEAFPLSVVEAGALGVPVIATRVGALPEVFADEILFLESSGGTPDLASARQAIAAAGRDWGEKLRGKVLEVCDPETVVARYAEVVEGALRRRRSPPAAVTPGAPGAR
jgi:glycosyltransferase involved in cell wall biosynthesis